jgi:hypothetical protein
MAPENFSFHTAVRFSEADMVLLENLCDYWGCSQSEAIRTAVRIADALAKEVGYARVTGFGK